MTLQYIFSTLRLGKVVPPSRYVLKDISLSFFPDAKIGVIGLNGAGKSSLLKIFAGVDTDFIGEARPAEGIRIGWLPQEPRLDPAKDVRGNVEEGVAETHALLKEFERISARFAEPMSDEEMSALLEQQGELQHRIDHLGAWELDRRSRAASAAVWRCVACSSPNPTCSSSTSRPTTSTRSRSPGWSGTSRSSPAASSP